MISYLAKNRRLLFKLTVVLSLLILTPNIVGIDLQHNRSFRHFFKGDGLNSHSVFVITQDRDGFMWFGTEAGLVRYDGDRFTVYNLDPNDKKTVNENHVFSIYEDRSGVLWVGTRSRGIYRFYKSSKSFVKMQMDKAGKPEDTCQNMVYSIIEDSEGVVWAGTMCGLNRFNTESNRFENYPLPNPAFTGHEQDSITWLFESLYHPELLWIATANNGLKCLDKKNGNVKHYVNDQTKPNSLSSNTVLSIAESPQNIYWICTNLGINRLDFLNGQIHMLRNKSEIPGETLTDRTFSVTPDHLGNLWVGTMGGGLRVVKSDGWVLEQFQHDPNFSGSLSNNHINHVYIDRSNLVWVGTIWGLNRYNPNQPIIQVSRHLPYVPNSLSNNWINDIAADHRGDLWIATDNGLNCLNRERGEINRYLYSEDLNIEAEGAVCRSVYHDHDESIWVGTSTGLVHVKKEEGEHLNFVHQDGNLQSLSHSTVNSILRDSHNTLWVGTQIGLNRMSGQNGLFERFFDQPSVIGEWYKNSFLNMLEDHSGMLWFGTHGGGLYRYKKGQFDHFLHNKDLPSSIPSDEITDLLCDKDGRVWIASRAGLSLWLGEDRFEHFQLTEGSFEAVALAEGYDGRLWVASPDQLLKYNPILRKIEVCLEMSQFGIYEFSPSAMSIADDGLLYLGGFDGMATIDTKQTFSDPKEAKVVITDIDLLGQNKSVISASNKKKDKLFLRAGDFPLVIRFNALDYTEIYHYSYAYRLTTNEKDKWIDIGSTHELTLLELGAGSYRLEVKTKREHHDWTQAQTLLNIVIIPPFWKTWWFWGIIFLFLAYISVRWHQTRIRRIVHKLKTESALKEFWLKLGMSPREIELIDLIIKGRTNQQIADELYLSLSTIKNHVYNIYRKLNINNRVQLISMVQNVDHQIQAEEAPQKEDNTSSS